MVRASPSLIDVSLGANCCQQEISDGKATIRQVVYGRNECLTIEKKRLILFIIMNLKFGFGCNPQSL